ncbi:MAG: hypothetical protein ACT4R6_12670, partial [Gemmatimonadaceae bacterium]
MGKRFRASAAVGGALFVATTLATLALPAQPPNALITFSRDRQRLSLRADQVPRGRVLSQLSTRLGVDIRAYDVDLTAPVTVSVADAPLDVVVARVLPADARYVIRYGERESPAALGRSGPKRPGTASVPQRGAPAKGRTRPYVRDARSVLKAPPRSEVAPERRAEGPGVKL